MSLYYSDIFFKQQANGFAHNHEGDYACFALWQTARPYREQIRDLLSSEFTVLLETEIEWSEEHFHSNASRLYEAPIYSDIPQGDLRSGHAKKIGGNKFILFVVKDNSPEYTYAMSVSGKVEMSNLNIVRAKYQMRDWIEKDTGIKYGVHSTNNILEFFFQVPLLLGKERFNKLINGEEIKEDYIQKDLEGAGGWKNYQEMFDILNMTTNYLVQRGFETLPDSNPEMDIDFLTDNYQRLASSLGANQYKNKLYKGTVLVKKQEVSLDIRFVGDKYYSVNWAQDMLSNKEIHKGIFVPRKDDYFFSLLFHAKVQKAQVKEKYVAIFEDIAKELKFEWYKTEFLENDEIIGKILNGYFSGHSYIYEDPIDNGVYKNNAVIQYLPTIEGAPQKKIKNKRLKAFARKVLPESMIKSIKKTLKR